MARAASAAEPSQSILRVGVLAITAATIALAVIAWGDWRSFVSHPARAGFVVAAVLFALATVCTDLNMSVGRRADLVDARMVLPASLLSLAMPPLVAFTDRHDVLSLDGDVVRYVGLGLFVGGGLLRVAPMFILGPRFSALVAIQPGHELVTTGLYRVVRHPSYLGGLIALVGWALVFRSAVGLLLFPAFVWLTVARMNAEETLLASEFGAAYAAYRGRTWRLVPFVY